jgi:hypothetical protein
MVKDIEGLEFSVLKFFVHHTLQAINLFAYSQHHIGVGQKRSKFKHMTLVVKQLPFSFYTLNAGELPPTNCVPNSNNKCPS